MVARVHALLLLAACHTVPPDATSADCGDCHPAQLQSWSASQHAIAYTDPIFQVSWAEERSDWCLTCHLPDDGVTCATCHGAQRKTCADCHEFDLPAVIGGAPSGTLGQSTVSEWEASGAAAQGMGCVDCHDPHHPVGGNDRERVREVLSAQVTAEGDRVHARLTAEGIGHAFPTGDPFRRLYLIVCEDLACSRPVARAELARRLTRTEDGGWALGSDTRIPPPAEGLTGVRQITLDAPGARAWKLVMQLTDPRHIDDLPDLARYVVATGPVERP